MKAFASTYSKIKINEDNSQATKSLPTTNKNKVIDIENHLSSNMVKQIEEMEYSFNLSVVFFNTKPILGYKLKAERDVNAYIDYWKLTNTGSSVLLLFSNADPGLDGYWQKNVRLITTDAKIDVAKVKLSEVKALEGITYELGADESLESWQLMYYGAITNIMGQLTEKGFLNTVFGDLELNEESELTVKKSDFVVQTTNCDCGCTAKKYTGTNPQKKNYMFNYVTTQPTTQALSLKTSEKEFEVDVLAKVVGSSKHPSLIDAYEIVTFEKARLKEGIEELNNRLNQGIPTMVGVTYGAKVKPYNKPGKTTDHYVVIVAKGYDKNGFYFRYFDPATSGGDDDDKCKLHISEKLLISGKARYPAVDGQNYYLVEIRLESKVLESCKESPVTNL